MPRICIIVTAERMQCVVPLQYNTRLRYQWNLLLHKEREQWRKRQQRVTGTDELLTYLLPASKVISSRYILSKM